MKVFKVFYLCKNILKMEMTERILQEASQLFMKHGIRSVTMDDIARQMGVSKRTIYEKFKDKDELLAHGISMHHQHQLQHKKEVLNSSKNVLEVIFRIMFDVVGSMNKVSPFFITDLKKYHYKVWKEHILSYQEEHISEMMNLINRGVEDGLFRSDINVEIVARMLNLQLQELTNENIFPPNVFPRAVVFENIIVNFTRGIATDKGIRIIEKIITDKKNELKK